MTYTSLATPVPNTKILVSSFGGLVKQNFDDHEGRIAAINANIGSWSGGTVATRINQLESGNFAKFAQTSGAQSLSATNVKLQFNNTINSNTPMVTAGGTNQDTMTTVKAGAFLVTASARCATAGAALELSIYSPGNVAFAIGNVKGTNGSANRSCSVTTMLQLAAGDTFAVNCFNNGTVGNVDTTWGTATNISIRYLGL